MKKIFVLMTILTLGFGSQAATSFTGDGYLYWKLDPVEEQLKFCYAMLAGVDYYTGETLFHCTIDNTGATAVFDLETMDEGTTDLAMSYYSQVTVDPSKPVLYMVELYNADGLIIGVSEQVSDSDLASGGYFARDMATSGVLNPYHFSARTPEPTVGLLLVFGLGVLALRRRAS